MSDKDDTRSSGDTLDTLNFKDNLVLWNVLLE
jgi:hypothetical protein